jgi:hypothetical protein
MVIMYGNAWWAKGQTLQARLHYRWQESGGRITGWPTITIVPAAASHIPFEACFRCAYTPGDGSQQISHM